MDDGQKIAFNRQVLGMSAYSIGLIFNTITFFNVIRTGMLRQSTGFYLISITVSDSFFLLCNGFMEEFYHESIDVDIFDASGEPIILCQAIVFLEQMFKYFRWFLLGAMLVDRCLYVSGKASMARLRIAAVVIILIGLLISGGMAGYWIKWVTDDSPISDDPYVRGTCKYSLAPQDPHGDWLYMEAFGRIIFPDVVLNVIIFVSAIALSCHTRGKGAQSLEADDLGLSKVLVAMGLLDLLILVPYLAINCLVLYLHRQFDVYDFSADTMQNFMYCGALFGKLTNFAMAINFFILLFSNRFRVSFCSSSEE